MDKKAMMMIMVLLAVLSCLVSLGVALWYYFSPSDKEDESTEEDETEDEEKNDSLLSDRPAFTLNVINGDNKTTETVTPTGDETVDVTVDGDTATTTGATTAGPAEQPAVLTCEEGQTESNGECVDVTPVDTTTPAEQQPAVDPTILTCAEGQMESDGKCVDVVPVETTTPAEPVTPVDSCNETKCNDWMNDMVIKNYWAFSTTSADGSPHKQCGGCPHRAFKAPYQVQLDSSTNAWKSTSSRSKAFDALKLQ